MKLYFQCPRTGENFSTDLFSLIDNRGVILNSHGEKVLQATVEICQPCPHCQEFHRYRAEDLACPLTYR